MKKKSVCSTAQKTAQQTACKALSTRIYIEQYYQATLNFENNLS